MDPNLIKLTKVLLTLIDLTNWAQNSLNDETSDRQAIAEHLTDEMRRLVNGTVPAIRNF